MFIEFGTFFIAMLMFPFIQNISAREIAEEEKTQRELTSELLELTSLLKENTIVMNETINIQNTVCETVYCMSTNITSD
jgi:hypothetical protein